MNNATRRLLEKYIKQQDIILEADIYNYDKDYKNHHINIARGYRLALESKLGNKTSEAIQSYRYNNLMSENSAS